MGTAVLKGGCLGKDNVFPPWPGTDRAEQDEIEDIDPFREVMPFRYDIDVYGADFTVKQLIDWLNRGAITLPSFDSLDRPHETEGESLPRAEAWTKLQKDRFIESLLLNLPVPGIFLASEPDRTFVVMDGRQRLLALREYCVDDEDGPTLEGVHEDFRDMAFRHLFPYERNRFENYLIHATVIKELSPTTDKASIYQLFERLNTGGTRLEPQEIRAALYPGRLARVLAELNRNEDWRALYGPESRRLKDQEMILRSLAMYDSGHSYRPPMKGFLNGYMGENRDPGDSRVAEMRRVFEQTVGQIRAGIGEDAFRPFGSRLNAAVLESVFVGVAQGCDRHPPSGGLRLKDPYSELLGNPEFREAVSSSTADETRVATRLRLSKQAFSAAR